MPIRKYLTGLLLLLFFAAVQAQNDALNLPAPLFILQNEGVVWRYAPDAEGVDAVTPPDAFVVDFGISTDGNLIAYRTENALFMSDMRTGAIETLDVAPGLPPRRGDGDTVAWAPDSSAVASTTESGLRVILRRADGNIPVDVVNTASDEGFYTVSWSPDSNYLVGLDSRGAHQIFALQGDTLALASQTPPSLDMVWTAPGWVAYAPLDGGIIRMNLADSNNLSIMRPADAFYSHMTLRANGEIAAFVRRGELETLSGVYTRINPQEGREDVVGGAAIDLSGGRWAPQNDLVMAFRGGVMALVNPLDGSGFALPISGAVTYQWGALEVPAAQGYPVPRNLFFLAPDDAGVTQVWQLPQNGNPPLVLTSAPENIAGYTVSIDGAFIAYSSAMQLWLQPVGGDPFTVTELNFNADSRPDFSPDGQALAYVDDSIRVFSLSEGTTTVYLQNDAERQYDRPRFSPDSQTLMIDVVTDSISTGL